MQAGKKKLLQPWVCAPSAETEGHLQKEKAVKGRGRQNHKAYYRHRVLPEGLSHGGLLRGGLSVPGLRGYVLCDYVRASSSGSPASPRRLGWFRLQEVQPPLDFQTLREAAETPAFAAAAVGRAW